LEPLLVDVRYWYPDMPELASVEPLAVTLTDAAFCQLSDPPFRVGGVGAVRSSRTVVSGVGADGSQPDWKPAASTARNCTSVSPCALIVAVAPVAAEPQEVPPSVEVRYW